MTQLFITICSILFGFVNSQCNGPPLILMPNNSSGNLAFPEVNLDPVTGSWRETESYPESVTCMWILRAPPLHCFYMKILHFDTEEDFDFVRFYSSEDRSEELFHFSGQLKEPWETVIESGTLVVEFFSDDFTTSHGFHFIYRNMPKACIYDGVTISEPQLIAVPPWNLQGALPGPKKPGFEAPKSSELLSGSSELPSVTWLQMSTYPQGLNCTWKIYVESHQMLQLDVLKFDTDEDDVMQIWQVESSGVRPLYKLWADHVARESIQTGFPLLLNFFSGLDQLGSGSGFLLNVSYVSRACSPDEEVHSTPHGAIAYPSHNLKGGRWLTSNVIFYGADSCMWKIIAPKGYSINITVIEFDTRLQDTLQIKEGNTTLMAYGGPDLPVREFYSQENEILIIFDSLSESSNAGFLITYSWLIRKCQFKLEADQGEVRSPYYPDAYGGGLQCQWQLMTPPGHIAQFLIFRVRLDHGDFLQITDDTTNVVLSQDFNTAGMWKFAPSRPVNVNFISDDDHNKGYFLLKYNIYKPGNCDFSLTSCDYQPVDPLQVWDIKATEKMLFVDESNLEIQLPRGYRMKLQSPLIIPEGTPGEPLEMCLKLQYLLNGQDAFLFTVTKEEVGQSKLNSSVRLPLLSVHGPQGEQVLSEAVNFTASKPFQLLLNYERGYGPHYKLVIKRIEVLHEPCHRVEEVSSSFSCQFQTSFCGWKNTHKDHKNWLLQNHRITAKVNDNSGGFSWLKKQNKLQRQIADLVSPRLTLTDLTKNGRGDFCLQMSYEIGTLTADLKVIVISSSDNDTLVSSMWDQQRRSEREIWTQGRVPSGGILTARIPLSSDSIPQDFKVILRSSSVKVNRQTNFNVESSGISVHNILLVPELCPNLLNCDFTDGFCSWKVSSDGNTVWHIRNSAENPSNNFAGIHSTDVTEKVTEMTSPFVTNEQPQSLTFKYSLRKTTQCLKVGVMQSSGNSLAETKFIWEQCKSKGNQWLNECINLPYSQHPYQVVFRSTTGLHDSEVWVDDIEISSELCLQRNLEEHTVWQCDPVDSLCGLTQPGIGHFDWGIQNEANEHSSFYHHTENEVQEHHSTNDAPPIDYYDTNHLSIPDKSKELPLNPDYDSIEYKNDIHPLSSPTPPVSGFQCPDGRLLETDWVCDGVPDCEDLSDEQGCDCGPEGCGNPVDPEIPMGPGICNEGSFRCPSGRNCPAGGCSRHLSPCLPRVNLCDGVVDCTEGEDETSCGGVVREPSMDYNWQSDESVKPKESEGRHKREHHRGESKLRDRMECSGGLLVPLIFRCDGRKDCPLDGLDEVGCYHCGSTDFACPKSGVCLPKSSVCDGNLSVQSCTDEIGCNSCPPAHFACDVCLPSFKVCDGVWDCNEGEDETRCFGPGVNTENEASLLEKTHREDFANAFYPQSEGCQGFICSDGKCLPPSAVCDRRRDCEDDEINCPDDNKEETISISAKPSPGSFREAEDFPSYLITPVLHHEEGAVGVLSFKYRLDAWIGASNATLSVEILDANYSRTSLLPWAIWRQSGHKGTLWLRTQVSIPEMTNIRQYRIAFLLHSNGVPSESQQIHLSKISFKMVPYDTRVSSGFSQPLCEFENSWCGWTQSYTASGYSWVHAMASPHSRRTGPITGYPDGASTGFIFTDSLQGNERDTADLLSPPLMLSAHNSSICLRFAVFLYGSHIASLSAHAIQAPSKGVGHHPFASDLFQTTGSQGLTWVIVRVTIDGSHLDDPRDPFVVIIRATRGNGPEADIALDHISIQEGTCDGQSQNNQIILTQAVVNAKYLSINALKAGPSFTPYADPFESSDNNLTSGVDPCKASPSCADCVSSALHECIWCTSTHSCVNELSIQGLKCSSRYTITSDNTQFKSNWCPRVVSSEYNNAFMVPAESTISLNFEVQNIEISDTTGSWLCTFVIEDQKSTSEDDILSHLSGMTGFQRNEPDGSGLLNELKNYAIRKHQQNLIVRVPGHFKGTVMSVGEGHREVGMGSIACGNGESVFNVPVSDKLTKASVQLESANGYKLDNTNSIQIEIYHCEGKGSTCESCVNLNATFSCGWCSGTKSCSTHAQCTNGMWHSHKPDATGDICSIQDEFDFLKTLLGSDNQDTDFGMFGGELFGPEMDLRAPRKHKKKVKNKMKKFLGDERMNHFEDEEDFQEEQIMKKKNKKNKQGGKGKAGKGDKGKIKIGKKGKGRGFLKVPVEQGVYVARDIWRLHTGRQYYIPVTKKTMVNLGFVRQITYGSLSKEKARTVLMDGSWKKAAGYYIDMFEKANQDPVTSIITTKKANFDKLLTQLEQD